MAKLATTNDCKSFELLLWPRSFEIHFSVFFSWQFKYKDCKARARKNLPYDASDNMIIEILKEYCPQMLQRQASETNLDDTMKEQLDSSTFSDPFKIECETVEGGEEEQTGFDGSDLDNESPENIPDDDGSDSHQLPTTRSIDEMQQEMMELQNYKLKLELLKMERELYLQPSKYTRSIVESQGYRQDQFE